MNLNGIYLMMCNRESQCMQRLWEFSIAAMVIMQWGMEYYCFSWNILQLVGSTSDLIRRELNSSSWCKWLVLLYKFIDSVLVNWSSPRLVFVCSCFILYLPNKSIPHSSLTPLYIWKQCCRFESQTELCTHFDAEAQW